jgi:hypothetical protein
LEIQVAMVLLSIGMAGLYSMSVVQTKQTRQLRDLLPADELPALNQAANAWERKLGVYASIDGAVTPVGSISPYTYAEQVIDNNDGSAGLVMHKDPADILGWYPWSYWPAYRGNAHYHPSYGRTGSYAEFRVTGLPIGEYEVLTSYPAIASLGASIPHRIYDDTQLRATVNVNQRIPPSEVTYDGRQWDRIAVIQVNSGTVRVRLTDGPGCQSYILADAVLIRSARSFNLLSVAKTAGGGATAIVEAP